MTADQPLTGDELAPNYVAALDAKIANAQAALLQPLTADELAALTIPERACGYTMVDSDGEECPCDEPGTSWRWYQGHFHDDALDRACPDHENPGGILMAALVAEIRDLRAGRARRSRPSASALDPLDLRPQPLTGDELAATILRLVAEVERGEKR